VNFRAWFNLARRVVNLTVQLDARASELRDVHKQVAYWRQIAGERWDEVQRLNGKVNAAPEPKPGAMGDLVPAVAPVPLGSRDRANALKLAAENADLRAEVERLQIALKEGNPS
jgi:hypothetical protein